MKGIVTQLVFPLSNQANGIRANHPHLHPRRLFAYLITTHRNSALECDYNLHKSNSTFFSDLDINRAQLLVALFGGLPKWKSPENGAKEKSLRAALGGTSCVFKREIKPLQQYEVWSRVLAWDEKWLYIVSYFVKKGAGKALERGNAPASGEGPDINSVILASSVTRYVFKDGRITVPPRDVLVKAGLHPSGNEVSEDGDAEARKRTPGDGDGDGDGDSTTKACEWTTRWFEAQREHGLQAATSLTGSESLPAHFGEIAVWTLGRYADL